MKMPRPSTLLKRNRKFIYQLAEKYRVRNPRVFGSIAAGTDTEESDIDILVDETPETTFFKLGGLQIELEERLGVKVDVCTPGDLPEKFRQDVINRAIAI